MTSHPSGNIEPVTVVKTPDNVVAALAAVMRDMPGIGKGGKSQQGYSYRGIEQITAAIQPLLAKHSVVFIPRVLSVETTEVTVNGKPWTDERLRVEYTVYGPGGVEDCIKVGPVLGIGRDNSDKGANKAMSQAYKYALLQTLCIGDAKDDGDQQTHESDSRRPQQDRGAGQAVREDASVTTTPQQTRPTPPPNVDPATGEIKERPVAQPRTVNAPKPKAEKPTIIEAAQHVKGVDPVGDDEFAAIQVRVDELSEAGLASFKKQMEAAKLVSFSATSPRRDIQIVKALLAAAEKASDAA